MDVNQVLFDQGYPTEMNLIADVGAKNAHQEPSDADFIQNFNAVMADYETEKYPVLSDDRAAAYFQPGKDLQDENDFLPFSMLNMAQPQLIDADIDYSNTLDVKILEPLDRAQTYFSTNNVSYSDVESVNLTIEANLRYVANVNDIQLPYSENHAPMLDQQSLIYSANNSANVTNEMLVNLDVENAVINDSQLQALITQSNSSEAMKDIFNRDKKFAINNESERWSQSNNEAFNNEKFNASTSTFTQNSNLVHSDELKKQEVDSDVQINSNLRQTESTSTTQEGYVVVNHQVSDTSVANHQFIEVTDKEAIQSEKMLFNQVEDQVKIMVNQQMKTAHIQLDPEEMGLIEIRVEQKDNQARIVFSASVEATREMLESRMDVLKNLLAANGLELGDVHVSDHSHQKHPQERNDTPKFQNQTQYSFEQPDNVIQSTKKPDMSSGTLDLYA